MNEAGKAVMGKVLATLLIALMLTVGGSNVRGQSKLPPCSNVLSPSSWDNCQGTITFANGDKYVGQFKDGKFNGQGTNTFANKEKYVGLFKDNMRNGQGTYFAANGSIQASGIWADDKFVGAVANREIIKMEEVGGVYVVPVLINDAITLDFVVDTGASDVRIPADVVMTLIRTGTIKAADFQGEQKYRLADGSTAPSQTFRIRSLEVGGKVVENVNGSIGSVKGGLLLGQSFLGRFKSWSIDNTKHALILE